MAAERLKDHSKESRTFRFRATLAFIVVVLMLCVLAGRMYYLQVVEHERFSAMSEDNRVQLQPVPPTRGLIYDRNGILLADNRPSYSVTLLKEEMKDLDKTLADLSELIPITEREISRFKKRLKQRRRPFQSVPVRFRLTEEEIAKISVNYHRLPGIRVEAELIRYYPYGRSLVHAMGYVGRINEKELKRVDETNYAATHYIGKLGIEKFYEDQLHGEVGFQKVETNARGRVMRVLERTDPKPGEDLVLHLDLRLQQITEKLLEGRRASVVAIDPETGGILTMVSTPAYDPNLFVTGISSKDYKALRESRDLPLFNRAIRGGYPPGSTIKQIVALAAIDTGVVKPSYTIFDPGFYTLTKGGRKYRDWKRTGHGRVDMYDSIAQSCDVWFYDVSHKMGVDPMSDYLGKFGFGQVTSLDLPEALGAILPSREWKKRARKTPWYTGDSLNMSIGQGFFVATPLQLATATAVVANRGKWHSPRMLKGIKSLDDAGAEVLSMPDISGVKRPLADVKLNNEKHWDDIIKGMREVMHGKRGTARSSGANSAYEIAGKTGTAQVVGIKQDEEYDAEKLAEIHRDHALFVAFAPIEDPKIAIAVIVENGGGGSSTAAPIARKVMDAYLLGKDPEQEIEGEVALR
ncbi:penicillin-binding protein 2 [Neptuniibacter caesariensis]|uniref:Peptidoglycan D,D-transpeptidase MrdA n=1 Tax=Neptuniibacter caesariensis TaxID=207954 RepID=A0A7U8GU36_NEPCE|nr:penicillin-binding protein 2 [Neptuniibacter caesariensis]EAR62983.1 penicillin-binding protein 2 [Oceanospirillum sp. MED92] [Neptuniibacter caesariensis]